MNDIQVKWLGKMKFEGNVREHKLTLDTTSDYGGEDTGAKPMEFVLIGLIGCTAMDVIYILGKMRQEFTDFSVQVAETARSSEHPKVWTKIHLVYKIHGQNLKEHKVLEAVELSQQKYCSVSGMLKQSAEITYDIIMNDVQIKNEPAN